MALELRERPGGAGVERRQAVEVQPVALEFRERLGSAGVERGQAIEVQVEQARKWLEDNPSASKCVCLALLQ